ncbi:winged helix family two component transcriptional regulator [Mizugakiibacter sediminis]|uniref:Transcriptional regulator n=1 Tax=Mizugakiibacter sediminis TaxID=1475481 RepID=A0A0K8QMB4_9GAMM|nr:response regulator transcription factor [Mizugakiibacter sediminis]GAP66019.1 winged helix family two component transcriptional regulator [Mizugakiibacter sediminis]
MKLLIVEDSERLRRNLRQGLAGAGFVVDAAADGVAAAGFLAGFDYDLVVLDLMLPRRDGFEVLRALPRDGRRPRTLVLSARDQVGDRVAALNAGADDYLVKPFAFEELLARLHALARRPALAQSPLLEHAGVALDSHARNACVHGAPLALTPREFALLELLLRHRGRVLARAEIHERLAGSDSTASDRGVEVLVFGLRRKLAAAGCAALIENRRGAGYLIP